MTAFLDLLRITSPVYRDAMEPQGDALCRDPMPEAWPEREAWLRRKLGHLCPTALQKEIAYHRAAYERDRNPNSVWAKRRAAFSNVLHVKSPQDARAFEHFMSLDAT